LPRRALARAGQRQHRLVRRSGWHLDQHMLPIGRQRRDTNTYGRTCRGIVVIDHDRAVHLAANHG